jgi:hypothetical protein
MRLRDLGRVFSRYEDCLKVVEVFTHLSRQ